MAARSGGTQLGELVRAGESGETAERIHDFVWVSRDVSNSYLVTGDDANVVINAGMPASGPRHRAAFGAASENPISHILVTQAHFDHFGGLAGFADAGAKLVAHRNFPEVRAYWKRLGPFYTRRSNHLWKDVLPMGERPLNFQDQFDIRPDILANDGDTLTVGGRNFVIRATPGGETLDSIVVWMPDEKVVFTGNAFGPIFLNHPNLNTLRGDLPRNALRFVEAVQLVQSLGAELLVTGHGEPIRGRERIHADLQKLMDAVLYVHDRTVEGMNAGKDVHTLMREIAVPDELRIGKGHGKVAINVRSIWEQYSGFFHYESTTELYGVPRSAVAPDLVALAGGPEPLVSRARAYIDQEDPLEALHLLDIVRAAAPECKPAREAEIAALQQLLERGNGENFSETMWLKAKMAEASKVFQ